jgi:hypothetical protein
MIAAPASRYVSRLLRLRASCLNLGLVEAVNSRLLEANSARRLAFGAWLSGREVKRSAKPRETTQNRLGGMMGVLGEK